MITKTNSLVARLACKLLPRPFIVEACRVGQDTTTFVRIGLPWVGHYTGSQFFDWSIRPFNVKYLALQLYMSRDSLGRLDLVRISGYHWMLGLFTGRANYLTPFGSKEGFELFTSAIHIGWAGGSIWRILWSGSVIDPRHTYTVRLGRFGIGSRTDNWLKRIIEKRDEKRMDAEMAAMDATYEAQGNQDDAYACERDENV